jgi:hypothetical protein
MSLAGVGFSGCVGNGGRGERMAESPAEQITKLQREIGEVVLDIDILKEAAPARLHRAWGLEEHHQTASCSAGRRLLTKPAYFKGRP